MSALPPIADIHRQGRNVRFVPKADIAPPTRSPRRREQAALPEQSDRALWQS